MTLSNEYRTVLQQAHAADPEWGNEGHLRAPGRPYRRLGQQAPAVEPEHLDAVLADIHGLARKGAFLVVSTRRARATLPDGRNAHLIVMARGWWTTKMYDLRWTRVGGALGKRGTIKFWLTK